MFLKLSIQRSRTLKSLLITLPAPDGDDQANFWQHSKTSFEKKLFFCVSENAEYGFDQQRLIWYVCRLWDMVFSWRFER